MINYLFAANVYVFVINDYHNISIVNVFIELVYHNISIVDVLIGNE